MNSRQNGNKGVDEMGLDSVDEMGLDKMGIDKMGIDKMGLDKMGIDKMGSYHVMIVLCYILTSIDKLVSIY